MFKTEKAPVIDNHKTEVCAKAKIVLVHYQFHFYLEKIVCLELEERLTSAKIYLQAKCR